MTFLARWIPNVVADMLASLSRNVAPEVLLEIQLSLFVVRKEQLNLPQLNPTSAQITQLVHGTTRALHLLV